jgi:hypothetical protein
MLTEPAKLKNSRTPTRVVAMAASGMATNVRRVGEVRQGRERGGSLHRTDRMEAAHTARDVCRLHWMCAVDGPGERMWPPHSGV